VTVRVLGVRHHGPSSARAVVTALSGLDPTVILIEGPPEADALVRFATDPDLVPPVALLAYAADDASVASFWPFAVFSPEWQALRWAVQRGAEVRFCDLPAAQVLARPPRGPLAPDEPGSTSDADQTESPTTSGDGSAGSDGPSGSGGGPDGGGGPGRDGLSDSDGEPPGAPSGADGGGSGAVDVRGDPLAALAAAAGYDDPERWWDEVIESREAGPDPFDAIVEAMTELRSVQPKSGFDAAWEARREAQMRTVLRRAMKEHERVAVVCGAWHTPALTGKLPTATADAALLRGAPKRKVELTWVPWTHGRLAIASGYGAGVTSPGWYHHLFTVPDRPVARWLTAVAGVLRAEDLPVSTAHVIEAVRLAEGVAGLRGRVLPGLAEVTDATRAVLADGDEVLLDLVVRRLVVGEALGRVPDAAPTVPLQADLTAQARRLRLKLDPAEKTVELDLRKPLDLDRSTLLHRLDLLEIGWGVPARSDVRSTGTFRETWSLAWAPELSVAVVAAATYGTTVAAAATAKLTATTGGLSELTAAVERCLLADLPAALPALLAALDAAAAADTDVAHLMSALPALARALRYGDVRGTGTGALAGVADVLLVRVCAGLPVAVSNLDSEAAAEVGRRIDEVNAAVALLPGDGGRDRWLDTLTGLSERDGLPGLIAGRLVRLLLDAGRLDRDGAAARLRRALSVGPVPADKAAWVEGFLAGRGTLLVHDIDLLGLLDEWVATLDPDEFVRVLPLLRRTFSTFEPAERRAIGERLRRGTTRTVTVHSDVDEARAEAALPVVATLLGLAAR
jgi:Family of unknown function (DUF5682)